MPDAARMERTLIWIYQQLQAARDLADLAGDTPHARYLSTRMERILWALSEDISSSEEPLCLQSSEIVGIRFTPIVSRRLKR